MFYNINGFVCNFKNDVVGVLLGFGVSFLFLGSKFVILVFGVMIF